MDQSKHQLPAACSEAMAGELHDIPYTKAIKNRAQSHDQHHIIPSNQRALDLSILLTLLDEPGPFYWVGFLLIRHRSARTQKAFNHTRVYGLRGIFPSY